MLGPDSQISPVVPDRNAVAVGVHDARRHTRRRTDGVQPGGLVVEWQYELAW